MTKEQRQTIVKFLDTEADKYWYLIGDHMARIQTMWGRGDLTMMQHETFNLHMTVRHYNTVKDMKREVEAFDEPIEGKR